MRKEAPYVYYALISGFEKAGVKQDLRGKIATDKNKKLSQKMLESGFHLRPNTIRDYCFYCTGRPLKSKPSITYLEELTRYAFGLTWDEFIDQEGANALETFKDFGGDIDTDGNSKFDQVLLDLPLKDKMYLKVRGVEFKIENQRVIVISMLVLTFFIASTVYLMWPSSPEIDVTSYLETPYPNSFTSRGDGDGWISAYDTGNYVTAIQQLKAKDSLSNQKQFYLGLSYLYAGEYQIAIDVFDGLYQDELVGSQSLWFSAIGHLMLDDPESAEALLIRLMNQSDFKKAEASSIIEKL